MWDIEKVHILALFEAHPDDFLVAHEAEKLIGFILAIKYTDNFGFISTFLVLKEHRGEGYGKNLFNHALSHLEDRQVALDSNQKDIYLYEEYGFKAYFDVVNYMHLSFNNKKDESKVKFIELSDEVFLVKKDVYMKSILQSKEVHYKSIVRNNKISSYAFSYKYIDGYKISINTDCIDDAKALFIYLSNVYAEGTKIYIQASKLNQVFIELVNYFSMKEYSKSTRMYNKVLD